MQIKNINNKNIKEYNLNGNEKKQEVLLNIDFE